MKNAILSISIGFLLATLPACGQTGDQASAGAAPAPAQTEKKEQKDQKTTMQDVAVLETNLGTIVITFMPDKAPGHVKNFEDLAKKGFYNGTKFHRVIPGFMIQGGDPNSKDDDRSNDGTGGPGYQIKAEFNDVKHERGIVSMARSSDPDSAGSQFFIMVTKYPSLDGHYTAFGKVIEGLDVVDKIVNLPRDERDNPLPANPAIIKSVKIEKRAVPTS